MSLPIAELVPPHIRSFEAYVSNMAGSAGLGTEFIGKGDANYKSDAEDRFARTFPDRHPERIDVQPCHPE